MIPTSATVPQGGQLVIAATVNGATNQTVTAQLTNGLGTVVTTGLGTAVYTAPLANGTASVRITAAADANATKDVPITISPVDALLVVPQVFPQGTTLSGYVIGPASRQTFAAIEGLSSNGFARGLEGVMWSIWPHGTITAGTATLANTAGQVFVFANDPVSNRWGSSELSVSTTNLPSVEVTPTQTTVAPNGVVQLTAIVSTGVGVRWDVASAAGGSVNSSGQYTAPATAGVYVVQATPLGGSGSRFAIATIIVR